MNKENKVLKVIHEKAPNAVRFEWVAAALKDMPESEVLAVLEQLVAEDKLSCKPDNRSGLLKPINYYKLLNYSNIPIQENIKIGEAEIPRLLSVSVSGNFPEEFNEAISALSRYSESLESRFVMLVKKEQNKYWGQVITLFGLFISLLSIIIVGLPKIATDPSLSFWLIFKLNLAQLLPIVIVMIGFVLLLKWAFK